MLKSNFMKTKGNRPWRREWQPTPVFLPGESRGQGSLVGCSPWGRKESDTTEWLTHAKATRGLPGWLSGKETTCQCMRRGTLGLDPWVWKIPWRRTRQPPPPQYSCLENPKGQRSLVGYSIGVAKGQTRQRPSVKRQQEAKGKFIQMAWIAFKNDLFFRRLIENGNTSSQVVWRTLFLNILFFLKTFYLSTWLP